MNLAPNDHARAHAVALLADTRADALVCLFDGMHEFLDPEPVLELTDFKPLDETAVLVDRDGAMTLVVSPSWDAGRARERLAERGAVIGCADVAAALPSLLGRGMRVATCGLELVPDRYRKTLEPVVEIVPVDAAITQRQRPKTSAELARARRGAASAERAFDLLVSHLRPGVAEFELTALLQGALLREGADDAFLAVVSDATGQRLRQPTDRVLRAGDVVNIEISPAIESQFVQICRTLVVGRADQQRRQDYALLASAFNAGCAAGKPGATVAELVAAIDRPLVAGGLAEYVRPPHIRVRGHCLGLASQSPGDIRFDSDMVLEVGMVFALHPNQTFPESGYMLCGEPVVITAEGARCLTRRPVALEEVAC